MEAVQRFQTLETLKNVTYLVFDYKIGFHTTENERLKVWGSIFHFYPAPRQRRIPSCLPCKFISDIPAGSVRNVRQRYNREERAHWRIWFSFFRLLIRVRLDVLSAIPPSLQAVSSALVAAALSEYALPRPEARTASWSSSLKILERYI